MKDKEDKTVTLLEHLGYKIFLNNKKGWWAVAPDGNELYRITIPHTEHHYPCIDLCKNAIVRDFTYKVFGK